VRIFIAILLFLTASASAESPLLTSATSDSSAQILTANSHWLPWRKVDSDGHLNGIEVDILKRLSQRLHLKLKTKSCGWKRCLKHMEVGESDIMTGLFKTPEREKYMKFIKPAYRVTQGTCFYVNKNSLTEINDYKDLSELTIGVVKGVSYFKRFDKDDKIKKYPLTTGTNLFRLLEVNRIDAVIFACAAGDVRLKDEHLNSKVRRANYIYRVDHPVYIALSKKSSLLSREAEISQNLQSMLDLGEIEKILSSYGIVDIREKSH